MRNVFADILRNKDNYLRAETGEDFEDRFAQALKAEGYTKLLKRDIATADFKALKEFVIQKKATDYLPFKEHPMSFIHIPFGSQNYPDFVIFTGEYAVPVEIKYSKKSQKKPIWNSGIPRANGIYIFGSYGRKDITFFLGSDILDQKRRVALIDFFEEIKKREKEFDEFALRELADEENRGFMPYIRRAYDQKKIAKTTELDYFAHPDRKRLEEHVLEAVKQLSKA